MRITLENLPYLCLIWIGIGFCIILIGVFIIAYMKFDEEDYTQYVDMSRIQDLNQINEDEVFSKVLQKQEIKRTQNVQVEIGSKDIYSRIKSLHEEGKRDEEIAKILNVGMGEVQLILSLYKMR